MKNLKNHKLIKRTGENQERINSVLDCTDYIIVEQYLEKV